MVELDDESSNPSKPLRSLREHLPRKKGRNSIARRRKSLAMVSSD
jgi:hypothetical protein